jgi:hypothetical protein
MPPSAATKKKRYAKRRAYSPTRKRLMAAMKEEPRTIEQLAEAVHTSKQNTQFLIRELHKAGKIYVKRWERNGGRGAQCRVFAVGNKMDAPRPAIIPPAERCARWREKGGDSHMAHKVRTLIERPKTIGIWGV